MQVRLGVVLLIGGILAVMGASMYLYTQYQTNLIVVGEGEEVTVGPVRYAVTFDGVHDGSEDVRPENTFVGIRITAENVGDERTRLSGGQFYIVDVDGKRHQPEYGEFSAHDLLLEWLEPGEPVERTTQFDIPYDEDATYTVIVRPQKDQSSVDTARICITNC